MKKLGRFWIGLMALAVALAGCGGGAKQTAPASTPNQSAPASSSTTETAKPAAPVQDVTKVSLAIGGSKGSILYLPPVFAEYNNNFKNVGIDIDILDMKGGAQAQQALVSGQVDFASMAVEHAVKAKTQGVDLVMLALYWRYPTVALVVDNKYKDKVKSVADLKGMKIGITSPGSGSHKVLLSLLSKHGLQPTDVEIVGTGMPGMPEALATGQIQAAANYDPYVTQVVNGGQAFILWDTRTQKDTEALYGGEYPFVGLVTRREVLEQKPELVARVVKAIVQSNQFLTTHPAEEVASKLPAEVVGKDLGLYVKALKANLEAFAPNGQATEAGLRIVIESLKADNVIPASAEVEPRMVFDGTYAQRT